MPTAQPQTMLLTSPAADGADGRAIRCKGCGEIGRAAWAQGTAEVFQAMPEVTHLSGNFYLHHGHIACGRCQQIHRADG